MIERERPFRALAGIAPPRLSPSPSAAAGRFQNRTRTSPSGGQSTGCLRPSPPATAKEDHVRNRINETGYHGASRARMQDDCHVPTAALSLAAIMDFCAWMILSRYQSSAMNASIAIFFSRMPMTQDMRRKLLTIKKAYLHLIAVAERHGHACHGASCGPVRSGTVSFPHLPFDNVESQRHLPCRT